MFFYLNSAKDKREQQQVFSMSRCRRDDVRSPTRRDAFRQNATTLLRQRQQRRVVLPADEHFLTTSGNTLHVNHITKKLRQRRSFGGRRHVTSHLRFQEQHRLGTATVTSLDSFGRKTSVHPCRLPSVEINQRFTKF